MTGRARALRLASVLAGIWCLAACGGGTNDVDSGAAMDAEPSDAAPREDAADAAEAPDSSLPPDGGPCATGADGDSDGHRSFECGGDDCDDADPRRFPGNPEVCDTMDRDEDCDPSTYGFRDADGDGEPDGACCNDDGSGTGDQNCGSDCDDMRPGIHPAAPEVCDGLDTDCDGAVDETVLRTFYVDGDGDSYGVDAAATNMQACFAPTGYSDTAGDCNDAVGAVHPGLPDVCDAAMVDDDCDGTPNNPPDGCSCSGTESRACTAAGECASGTEMCSGGTWGSCSVAPVTEACDGRDEDCDGVIDDGVQTTCYADGDGDGYAGSGAPATPMCPGSGGFGGCPSGFTTRTPIGTTLDCDDTSYAASPSATEICNAIDDDCDGMTDEMLTVTCYADVDNDGWAATTAPAQSVCASSDPSRSAFGLCPLGYTNRVPTTGDCNDVDPSRSPGAAEICDGVDQDCDGMVDDGVTVICFDDVDGDTFAASSAAMASVCPDPSRTMVGSCPFGRTNRAPVSMGTTDCNDLSASISPMAAEICDTIDNDCDGMLNEGTTVVCYADGDNDGYAGTAAAMNACPDPTRGAVGQCPLGFTNVAGSGPALDCNDAAILVHPGATETCNGVDDNCSGAADEGLSTRWYRDADNDLYGSPAMFVDACTNPGGYVSDATDCNDAIAAIHPTATEVCNGFDDNCAGGVDEGLPTTTVYADADGDGYGVTAMPSSRCGGTPGYSTTGGDCNDASASIHPGASEICLNGVDDDCSGLADDNTPTWYRDDDFDGYGGTNATPVVQCSAPASGHWVTQGGDCRDGVGFQYVYPGAPELCDGYDTDCTTTANPADGEVPNSFGLNYPGEDNDVDGHGDVTCSAPGGGASTRLDDCNDGAADVYTGATEIVGNNVDNDCNGGELCYFDADDDGFSRADGATRASTDADCNDTGEGLATEPRTDCLDTNAAVRPGAAVVADNALDDDCDGTYECFFDADDDGFSRSDAAVRDDSADTDCNDAGEGASSEPRTDCNDANASVSPGDAEVADNGVDDNCSGFHGCYYDADDDAFSRSDAAIRDDSADADCLDAGEGANGEPRTDCLDTNAAVRPGVTELGDDGLDNNCNGSWGCFVDADDDGYRPVGSTTVNDTSTDADCLDAGEGASSEPLTDCLDSNAAVHPGAALVADNALDDDCSGAFECYYDADNDGYSRSDAAIRNDSIDADCADSGEGSSAEPRTDCNDSNASVRPGVAEIADNGLDDNCSGRWGCYYDADNDAYSRSDGAIRDDSLDSDCLDSGEGRSTEPRTDCCDTEVDAHPGQLSYFPTTRTGCGGYDYNCDGTSTQQFTTLRSYSCTYDSELRECVFSGGSFGWATTVPACGASATYYDDCSPSSPCTRVGSSVTQACR